MNITTKGTYKDDNGIKGRVIRKAAIARQLLDYVGTEPTNTIRVIDVKPDKTDPDHKRSVIVFEDNEKFQEVFSKVIEENNKKREDAKTSEIDILKKELEELKKKFEDKE